MTGKTYRQRIAELGLTQEGAAAFFGVSPRTGRYWVQYSPHPAAAKLLEVMHDFGLSVVDIEERTFNRAQGARSPLSHRRRNPQIND